MFEADSRYLSRSVDYGFVLGALIRGHHGAAQAQLDRSIPGYLNPAENLLSAGTSIDGVQIAGELGLVA